MANLTTAERYRQLAIELAGMAASALSHATALEYSAIATRYARLAAYAERRDGVGLEAGASA
jgi:hypothetical protein